MINELIDGINVNTLDKKRLKEVLSGINFVDAETVESIPAITYFDKIVVNRERLLNYNSDKILYVLLHELCHFLRFRKLGKSKVLNHYICDDAESLFKFIIQEEILADRFACFMFYKLTGKELGIGNTQMLHLPMIQERYRQEVLQRFFKAFKSEEEYDEYGKKLYKER